MQCVKWPLIHKYSNPKPIILFNVHHFRWSILNESMKMLFYWKWTRLSIMIESAWECPLINYCFCFENFLANFFSFFFVGQVLCSWGKFINVSWWMKEGREAENDRCSKSEEGEGGWRWWGGGGHQTTASGGEYLLVDVVAVWVKYGDTEKDKLAQ